MLAGVLAVQARYTQQLSAVGFLGTEIAVRYTSAYEINIRSTLLPLMEGDGIVRVRRLLCSCCARSVFPARSLWHPLQTRGLWQDWLGLGARMRDIAGWSCCTSSPKRLFGSSSRPPVRLRRLAEPGHAGRPLAQVHARRGPDHAAAVVQQRQPGGPSGGKCDHRSFLGPAVDGRHPGTRGQRHRQRNGGGGGAAGCSGEFPSEVSLRPLWTCKLTVCACICSTPTQHPVPAVMVDVPVLALSDASLPSGQLLQLNASLILWGVHDEDMTRAPVTLDLSQRTLPVWRLGPAGQLFVQRVVSPASRTKVVADASGRARAQLKHSSPDGRAHLFAK